ncbi:MAG: hypothetical protein JSV78_13945 [Phycisphaerales bacterium]|nr:MAG: hypothetical protein JSV78_13945 [Phycisphaerales bacterium]
MTRSIPISFACVLLLLSSTLAKEPVEWIEGIEQGVAQSKQTQRPILFYIIPRGEDSTELMDKQQQSFRDPVVAGIIRERFTAIQMPKSTLASTLLEQMGAADATPLSIVVSTPDPKLVGTISAEEIIKPQVLAQKLTEFFRTYRSDLFRRQLQPILTDENASAGKVASALQLVEQFLITEADDAVVDLLAREKLSALVKERAYKTLAALSTPRSTGALLQAALEDEAAKEALATCTPAAVETLLSALDPKVLDRHTVAYEAVVQIFQIENPRPADFWKNAEEESATQEMERVKKIATETAEQWRQEHAAYR